MKKGSSECRCSMDGRQEIMLSTYRRLKQQRDAGEIDGGFTLIELLIVIVVLGILAAVVVFALGGITGQSAVAACKADVATVQTAVAAYEANNAGSIPTGGAAGNLVTGTPNYLQSWPSNGSHYAITIDAAGVVQVKVGATTVSGLAGCATAS